MFSLFASHLEQISRREFLKLSGIGVLAFFSLPLRLDRLLSTGLPENEVSLPHLGRVCAAKIDGFDRPSFNAELKKTYWRDLVLSISEVTIGGDDSGHNRIWYRVEDGAYVHSGDIQPVEIQKNQPAASLPEGGALAEVSVPFTDTLWDLRRQDWYSYRLYYGTTYWVDQIQTDKNGKIWYRIRDDKWKIFFYADATHLRLVSEKDVAPLSADVPPAEKRIEIHLPEQIVIAYEGNQAVFMARTSTGARFIDGDYRTPPGTYITNRKRPSRHMAAGDRAAPNSYDLPGVPWVCYLMDNGISFHGTYWHNNFGRPRSHGCINLSIPDSRWVYRWTYPPVPLQTVTLNEKTGTMVKVIDKPMA